jgi:hypothetical protein
MIPRAVILVLSRTLNLTYATVTQYFQLKGHASRFDSGFRSDTPVLLAHTRRGVGRHDR